MNFLLKDPLEWQQMQNAKLLLQLFVKNQERAAIFTKDGGNVLSQNFSHYRLKMLLD